MLKVCRCRSHCGRNSASTIQSRLDEIRGAAEYVTKIFTPPQPISIIHRECLDRLLPFDDVRRKRVVVIQAPICYFFHWALWSTKLRRREAPTLQQITYYPCQNDESAESHRAPRCAAAVSLQLQNPLPSCSTLVWVLATKVWCAAVVCRHWTNLNGGVIFLNEKIITSPIIRNVHSTVT